MRTTTAVERGRLRRVMKREGLTTSEVAKRIGVHYYTVQSYLWSWPLHRQETLHLIGEFAMAQEEGS